MLFATSYLSSVLTGSINSQDFTVCKYDVKIFVALISQCDLT